MQVSFLNYRNKPGMIYHTIHTPMPVYDYCTSKSYLNKRKHGGKVRCKYIKKVYMCRPALIFGCGCTVVKALIRCTC